MISELQEKELLTLLEGGAKELGITLSDEQKRKLLDYVKLLHKWNQAYNLTAIRDPKQMLIKHVLDSLSIHDFIEGKHAIDIGAGAGVPGMVLAIINPNVHWMLLDSNGKKTRFMMQAASELGLDNVNVTQARVESFQPDTQFDVIVSRAFSNIEDFVLKSKHLLSKDGVILAMKGSYPKDELKNFSAHVKVSSLKVPYLDEQRHLVCLRGTELG